MTMTMMLMMVIGRSRLDCKGQSDAGCLQAISHSRTTGWVVNLATIELKVPLTSKLFTELVSYLLNKLFKICSTLNCRNCISYNLISRTTGWVVNLVTSEMKVP